MNINAVLQSSTERLLRVSTAPRYEAQTLLAQILKVTCTYLHTWPEQMLTKHQLQQFQNLLSQRLAGQPLAYILKEQTFWSLDFYVNEHTLIPRPETELLIEIILKKFATAQSLKIIDLGTGCGAIALTLAKEKPHWQIVATDVVKETLAVAKMNGERHGLKNVRYYLSDWLADMNETDFNLIVSNPPYIAKNDPFLNTDVLATEPIRALIAGIHGLEAYEQIIPAAKKCLQPSGFILLEHGFTQGASLRQLLLQNNFNAIEQYHDLANHERAVFAKINEF